MASLITSQAWVSLAHNKGAVATEKQLAVPASVAGNTDTKGQGI